MKHPTRNCRALLAALAVASLCITAATASADDFSPYLPVQTGTFQGCSFTVGPILDPHPVPGVGYHTIGGASSARVKPTCPRR